MLFRSRKAENMSKISIIIPVYNSEKYLEKCLESMLNQTFKDIEVICINDGSTDNSWLILESFAKQDNRIVLLTQKNSGPAAARNNGLSHAKGKYIMFCDSDDWYEPDMCEKMLEGLKKENVDIIMCSARVFSDFKSTRDLVYTQRQFEKKEALYNLNNSMAKSLIDHALWNKIFKKEIIDKYDIEFPMTNFGEDRAFIMKYVSCSDQIYILKDMLYNYRLTPNSYCENLQNNKFKNLYDTIIAMQDVKKFFIENKLMEKNKYYFADKIKFSLRCYYKTCDEKHKKDFVLQHKKLISDIDLDDDFFNFQPLLLSLKKKSCKQTCCLLENKAYVSLGEIIFSIKNSYDRRHKIIRLLGIKIKFKRKQK